MSSIGLKILSKFYKINYNPIEISFNNFENFKKTVENSTYVAFDKNLGWDIIKNGSAMDSFYVSNNQGIRRKNNIDVSKKKFRISSHGDSFVHCDDVSNENTWQSFIEQRGKKFEVLNLGVGGYGTDQAFLKYKLTQKNLDADMVLIGYMTENCNRNVNTYRPFYVKNTQDINFSKPRFIYEKNQLKLIPNYFSSLSQMEVLAKKPKEHFNLLGEDDYFFNNSYKSSLFDFLPSIRFINISVDKIYNALVLEKHSHARYIDLISMAYNNGHSLLYQLSYRILFYLLDMRTVIKYLFFPIFLLNIQAMIGKSSSLNLLNNFLEKNLIDGYTKLFFLREYLFL